MVDFLATFLREIGSAGTLALLVAGAIFFFFRRDHLAKQDHYREISEKAIEVISRSAAADEKIADALKLHAESATRAASAEEKRADAYTRQIESIVREFARPRRRSR